MDRSPADLPIRGNLTSISTSFAEISLALKDWLADKAIDTAIKHALHALRIADNDPNITDLSGRLKDYIKLAWAVYPPFLQARFPSMGRQTEIARDKFKDIVDAAMRSRFGQYNDDICRLLVASKATRIELEKLRVVKKSSHVLFEEARRYYSWSGTLVDARLGNIFSGLDYSREFTLYILNERRAALRGDFDLSIRRCECQ